MKRKEWNARPGRSSKWISKANRWRIYNRDGFRCVYCASLSKLTLDHVKPRIRGGTHEPKNLVTCCSGCNSKRRGAPLRMFCAHIAEGSCWSFLEVMNRVRAARRRQI